MKCDKENIPPYLHWNEKRIFESHRFRYFHSLYRIKSIGNPITIPEAWGNAISCRWSKLIKKKDILLQPYSQLGNDYNFVFIEEIKKYYKKRHLRDERHEYAGVHVLTCVLAHSPLACDYSHCEILIRHRVFKIGETKPYFDETYTHRSWEEKTAMLKRLGGKFFKDLRSDFRVDMIKLISRESDTNTILLKVKTFFKCVTWNTIPNNP